MSTDRKEVSLLREVLPHLEEVSYLETLVVFDIDNTLIRPVQQLGSVEWLEHKKAIFLREGLSSEEVESMISHLWDFIQPHVQVMPIDPETSFVIKMIQSKKIPVICLTARGPHEVSYTHSQLRSIGVDISIPPLFPKVSQEIPLLFPALYDQGILFGSGNRKSEVFLSFLDKNGLSAKKVMFIDDVHQHVVDVEDSLCARNMECMAFRFSGSDRFLQAFNSELTDIQWRAFPHILSDEQASALLGDK